MMIEVAKATGGHLASRFRREPLHGDPVAAPLLQVSAHILHDDDGAVAEDPDGDGEAAEGHEVRREAQCAHPDEGDQAERGRIAITMRVERRFPRSR